MTKLYHWQGINKTGKFQTGSLLAENKRKIVQQLATEEIIITKISRQLSRTPKHRLLLRFTEQLSLLISSDIPIDKALNILHRTESDPILSAVIYKIMRALFHGQSFYHCLKQFPELFNELYIAFIETGERTNRLSTALNNLTQLLSHQNTLKSQIAKALRYPIFILLSIVFFSLGIFCFIIPQYQNFFQDLGGDLPQLTLTLLKISQYLSNNHLAILLTLTISFILTYFCYRQKPVRFFLDRAKLKTPGLKSLIIHTTLYHWCHIMALTCTSAIPLLEAVTLANRSIKNTVLRKVFSHLPNKLKTGINLADTLATMELFNAEIIQLIMIGENTGSLATVFNSISRYYQKRLHNTLEKLAKYIEPIAMLLLASLTGLIITALYLPMINFGLKLT